MFVLKKRDSYSWPVKFRIAVDGRYEDHKFTAEFKRLPQDRLDQVFGSNRKADISDDAFVREILIGWSDISDESGDALPFNGDNVATLLLVPGVRTAIIKAYFDSIAGIAEKN